jgi:hypothetical protein
MNIDDRLDELIFDYLEGNMSLEEQEAFMLLKEENEKFGQMVRVWKNTYVKEALPSIPELESKLLIHSAEPGRSFSGRIYILFMVLLIFLPADKIGRISNKTESAFQNQPPIDCPDKAEPVFKTKTKTKNKQDQKTGMTYTSTKQVDNSVAPIVVSKKEIELVTDLDLAMPFVFEKSTLKKIGYKKTFSEKANRKKWSRKEERLIRQKRWSDWRRAQAGFLSGNEPYVVPLNSNNF